MLQNIEAGCRAIGAEYRGGVCRRHSRGEAGNASEALQCRKTQPQICKSRKAEHRRPERFPARGLKERRSRLPRNSGTAFGESMGRKPGGWNETEVGAVGDDAPVGVRRRYALHIDLICRTAGYVTRTSGGVGGGSREASPYPKWGSQYAHAL